MTLRTVTFNPATHKLMPREATSEVVLAIDSMYAIGGDTYQEDWRDILAAVPDTLPGVIEHSGEPVAWMHDRPGRADVIHEAVKKVLRDTCDAAGHLNRPLDKSERYTIPLFTHAAPAQPDHLNDAVKLVAQPVERQELSDADILRLRDTIHQRDGGDQWDIAVARAAIAADREHA
jgi:argininosuccinate lyase